MPVIHKTLIRDWAIYNNQYWGKKLQKRNIIWYPSVKKGKLASTPCLSLSASSLSQKFTCWPPPLGYELTYAPIQRPDNCYHGQIKILTHFYNPNGSAGSFSIPICVLFRWIDARWLAFITTKIKFTLKSGWDLAQPTQVNTSLVPQVNLRAVYQIKQHINFIYFSRVT